MPIARALSRVACALLAASAAIAVQDGDWRSLPVGAERSAALEHALGETAGSEEWNEVVRAAYDAFNLEVEALRYEQAEALALEMHRTAQAPWSAWTLALLSTRLGEHERALALLEAEYERGRGQPGALEILGRLALANLGAGRAERARDMLGSALRGGSRDAAQILGRMALAAGDHEQARRLFASLLPADASLTSGPEFDSAPWGLRGWGLACLPRP